MGCLPASRIWQCTHEEYIVQALFEARQHDTTLMQTEKKFKGLIKADEDTSAVEVQLHFPFFSFVAEGGSEPTTRINFSFPQKQRLVRPVKPPEG